MKIVFVTDAAWTVRAHIAYLEALGHNAEACCSPAELNQVMCEEGIDLCIIDNILEGSEWTSSAGQNFRTRATEVVDKMLKWGILPRSIVLFTTAPLEDKAKADAMNRGIAVIDKTIGIKPFEQWITRHTTKGALTRA
jgi:hypothetical protein